MFLPHGNVALAVMIKQLAHQHPRTLIAGAAAGSGGNTGAVLEALGNRYASYTYTDISTSFFENARTVFSQHGSKLASEMLNVEDIQLCKGATVLCLGDLDNPVFRDMHPGRFKGLQNVMETAEVVVWVTSGAKEGLDPDVNIIFGLSSTLRAERLGRRLQFLDTDNPSSIDPSMLAKMLLRARLGPKSTAVVLDERQGAFGLHAVSVNSGAGDNALALSDENKSLVKVAGDDVLHRWHHNKTAAEDTAELHFFLAKALAGHLLGGFIKGLAWIHSAPHDLSEAIDAVAREQGVAVFQNPDHVQYGENFGRHFHPSPRVSRSLAGYTSPNPATGAPGLPFPSYALGRLCRRVGP
ncbi:Polyketide synthase 19 [Metarhizium brunneum]|uniref:Polyketide synthase 19 n=1 Tax=Metarhizium brunneum TaxID=500148 RepID=A0A7D5V280_9HYPO